MKADLKLVKANPWSISSVRVTMDRQGNVASVYLLLANHKMHDYTKKMYFSISDFVDTFGHPSEFSEEAISNMIVGSWVEISEYLELLEEEPVQNKRS